MNSISTFYHWVGISDGGLFQTALYCWVCQMLHETSFQISNIYSIGGQNRASELLWCESDEVLKNSKDLLEYIQPRSLSFCNSIKTFDFSTLYTHIPHSKLNDRLTEWVQLCFIKRNDQSRYKYLVPGRDKSYFAIKKNTQILPKSSLKLKSSTCSSF